MLEKCTFCDAELDENTAMVSDEHSLQPGESLCEPCYSDDETVASIRIFRPDGSEEMLGFGEVTAISEVDGDLGGMEDDHGWSFGYMRTDGWRGYYDEVVPEGWTRLDTDGCAMMMSEQAERLEDLDGRIRQVAAQRGLEVARVTARTSNVCSQAYSIYVKGDEAMAHDVLAEAESHQTVTQV